MPATRPQGLITKTYETPPPERPAGKGSRVRRFIITTDALDCDGEIVIPSGLRIDEYLSNGQLLWAHRYQEPPIGRCLDLELVRGGRALAGDFEFAKTKFADEIFGLYWDGFLRGCSIGFRATAAGPPSHEMLYARPELLKCVRVISAGKPFEVSGVPIPSNPDALMQAIESKILKLSPEIAAAVLPRVVRPEFRSVESQVAEKIAKGLGGVVGDAVLRGVADHVIGSAVREGLSRALRGPGR